MSAARRLAALLIANSREPEAPGETLRWAVGLLVLAVAAVALRWPATRIGPMSDDYMQYAMVAGIFPGDGYVPFDLYAFLRRGPLMIEHVEKGTAPWWSEPGLHGTVFRPLSSLLLSIDHWFLPGARAWHAHSQLWFGASIVSFGLLARALLPRGPALLAVLLYACEAGFVSPLGWLANRCVLVCATFGFAAFRVHLRWRRGEGGPKMARFGPWLEGLLVALTMTGGEYGLAILPYILMWEVVMGEGDWRTRGRGLLPALIPTLAYLAVHKALGYGTFGADVYADPVHSPAGWFKWAVMRMPKLMTGAFWSVPAATIHVFRHPAAVWWYELTVPPNPVPMDYHRIHAILGWLGVAAAGASVALARVALSEDERRTMRALLLGGILGLLPVTVAPSHSRLLIMVQPATCAVVALVLFGCARLLWARKWARGLALLPAALVLFGLHVPMDIAWGQRYIRHLDGMQAGNILAFTEGDLLQQPLEGRDVIVLNAPSQTAGLYGEYVLHQNGAPTPRSWRPLALSAEFPMAAFRPQADTLELTAIAGGAWMYTAGELFFRRDEARLRTGEVLEYPTLRVEILADTDDGHPTKVRFRFARDLDDPQYLFMISTPKGLMRWTVPPVGGRGVVPFARLPPPEDPDVILIPPVKRD
ncbi:hypothetical protein G6O69_32010 [Pseudenhygromyxa sp. WMMC2535]|uniref:hypothetical protein n=1 Tax=Pseudenhygromyxa sp. WMMC2535 TaxID=2712867 RepID=UPI0015519A21|nr:hypothetical protein [Pseudenhygromyxa sp. WMMC2535]NVB42492.1 hypothetical protein [Pseudenhygromyxa sp. WMMC2535]